MDTRRALPAVETGTTEHFSGKVEISLATVPPPDPIRALQVRFAAGGARHWPRRPFDQALQALEGEGHVQAGAAPLESSGAGTQGSPLQADGAGTAPPRR